MQTNFAEVPVFGQQVESKEVHATRANTLFRI